MKYVVVFLTVLALVAMVHGTFKFSSDPFYLTTSIITLVYIASPAHTDTDSLSSSGAVAAAADFGF